ncbi:MAG: hypothetical protein MJ252_29895 [archaeon]|nr:hypothetical protein [archaeon]
MAYQYEEEEDSIVDELSPDMKHDILLAFNLYKNDAGKITKLKLRSMLFSFVMYKTSPNEINEYIERQTAPDQELFSYEEVCRLVQIKFKKAKEKEADEIFSYLSSNKSELTKAKIKKAFEDNGVQMNEEEIKEMMQFMINTEKEAEYNEEEEQQQEGSETDSNKGKEEEEKNIVVSKGAFRKFYTNGK